MGNCSSGKKVNVESKRQKLNELDGNEIADALDVQYQQSPDIFKLNAICCDDLFEWLSMKDLDSLGQTCKRMHRLTGLYFQENFKTPRLLCENQKIYNKVYEPRAELCGLIPYVRSMTFYTFKKKEFQFIMENCDSLREIGFTRCKVKKSMIECIKERGHKIEAIFFDFTSSKIDFYSDFLKFCPNLKKLRCNNFPMKTDWMCHEYPQLEHFTFYDYYYGNRLNQISSEHLKIFLQRNAHIKSFGIGPWILREHSDIFLNSKLKLDVFTVLDFHPRLNTLLNRLYDIGFYKRLEIGDRVIDEIGTLYGLEKLTILTFSPMNYVDIPTVVSLVELCIIDHSGNADIYPSMAVSFQNLRKVHLSIVKTMDQILPFIAHLPKLKEFRIRRMEVIGFEIDLVTLHEERSKLAGTCKVIIYLPEDFYFATKQAPKNLYINHELIEIKRYELQLV